MRHFDAFGIALQQPFIFIFADIRPRPPAIAEAMKQSHKKRIE
jgi:hypothetical protein